MFYFLCPGCGLVLDLIGMLGCPVCGVCLFSGLFCFGLMPLSYDFKGGVVRFSSSLVAFGLLYYSCLFVWALPFGNKFLIIQKKKSTPSNKYGNKYFK